MYEYPWLDDDDDFEKLFGANKKKKKQRGPLFYIALGIIITLLLIYGVKELKKISEKDDVNRIRESGEPCVVDWQCKSGKCLGDNPWIYKDGKCE